LNRKNIIPLFLYIILNIIFFNSVLFGNSDFIIHDNFNFFYPSFIDRASFWNYRLQMGYPVAHDPQFQVFYLFKYLFPPNTLGFNLYIISSITFASYFSFLLILKITNHFEGALFGGLVFGWSGNFIGQLTMSVVISNSLWLPLLLLTHILLMENRNNKNIFILNSIVIYFNISSGSPQISIFNMIFVYLYILFQFKHDKEFYMNFRNTIFSTICGVFLCSIILLPALELMSFSLRSSQPNLEAFNAYNFKVRDLLKIIFPFIYGGIIKNDLFSFQYVYQMSGIDNFHEHQRYMGIITFLTLFFSFKEINNKKIKYFIIFSIIFYFLYSLGMDGPLGNILFKLPLINKFRGPNRHFLEFSLLISILSGFGIKRLESQINFNEKEKYFFLVVPVIVVLILIFGIKSVYDLNINYNLKDFLSYNGNNLISIQLFLLVILSITYFLYYHKLKNKYVYIIHIFLFLDLYIVSKNQDWFLLNSQSKNISEIEMKVAESANDSYAIINKSFHPAKIEDYYNPSFDNIYLTNNINNMINLRSFTIYSPLSFYDSMSINTLIQQNIDLGSIFSIKYFSTYYESKAPSLGQSSYYGKCNGVKPDILGNTNPIIFYKSLGQEIENKILVTFSILCLNDYTLLDNSSIKIIFHDELSNKFVYTLDPKEYYTTNSKCNNPSNFGFKYRLSKNECNYIFQKNIDLPEKFNLKMINVESENSILVIHSIGTKKDSISKFNYSYNYPIPNNSKIIYDNDGSLLFEIERVLPEFYFSNNVKIKTHEEIITLYQTQSLKEEILKTTYIETTNPEIIKNISTLSLNNSLNNKFIIKSEKNQHHIYIKVNLEYDSFLVINHTYFPGWISYIDDKETEIIKTNYIMRGIFVTKGEHTIRLNYEPNSMILGAVISLFIFISLIILKFSF
jgi:hypothetical protein